MSAINITGAAEYDAVISETVQKGLIVGEYSKGLKAKELYRKDVGVERVPANAGSSFSKWRKGRMTPKRRARGPIKTTDPNNGLTSQKAGAEKYEWNMERYGDTTDTELIGSAMSFKNGLKQDMYEIGEGASESLDLAVRLESMFAYKGGSTFVKTAAAGSQTTIEVDNAAGFGILMVNGIPTAVDATNKLPVYVNGVLNYVTACVFDTVNETISGVVRTFKDFRDTDDGVVGTLTLENAVSDPAVGWEVRSQYAPAQVRPNGRATEYQLAAGDELTMAHCNRITATLRNSGAHTFDDGCFHAYGDATHYEQLWNDPTFSQAFQGKPESAEFREGRVAKVAGIKFDFTGHCPKRDHPDPVKAAAGVKVKTLLIVGKEHVVEGRNPEFLSRPDLKPQATSNYVKFFDRKKFVEIILRGPQDRTGKVVSTSWEAVLAWIATTDSLTSYGGSVAYHKRGGIIQTV